MTCRRYKILNGGKTTLCYRHMYVFSLFSTSFFFILYNVTIFFRKKIGNYPKIIMLEDQLMHIEWNGITFKCLCWVIFNDENIHVIYFLVKNAIFVRINTIIFYKLFLCIYNIYLCKKIRIMSREKIIFFHCGIIPGVLLPFFASLGSKSFGLKEIKTLLWLIFFFWETYQYSSGGKIGEPDK